MVSNQSGSAVAEALPGLPGLSDLSSLSGLPDLAALPGEGEMGGWLPKQRSAADSLTVDSADMAFAPAGSPSPDAVRMDAVRTDAVHMDAVHMDPAAAPAAPVPAGLDPGECLRARILDQARQARSVADEDRTAKEAAARAREAAAQKVRDDAARKKAEEEDRKQAAADAAAQAEEERRALLAVSYIKPVTSYSLVSDFGGASSPWATCNLGQDFAVPTGTPAMAIHSGTITAAGWAGSYGYRIVLSLDDGTQLWYCHLSSMVKTVGRVGTGDVIGRVGATGNATVPQLHLEVRPGGGSPVDPLEWLREHGVCL